MAINNNATNSILAKFNKLLNFFIGKIPLSKTDEIVNLYSKSTAGLFNNFKNQVGYDYILENTLKYL